MNTVTVCGYEQEGHCEHCGRALKHCIRLSDGRIVGATCFDKKITKPKTYNGRAYRLGSGEIIKLARRVQKYNDEALVKYFGIEQSHRTFELA